MREKVVVELEIPSKLEKFIEKLSKFLEKDPKELVRERCMTHLESWPHDLEQYIVST